MSSESPVASSTSTITNPTVAPAWGNLARWLRPVQATTEFGIALQSISLMIITFVISRMVLFSWTKLPESAYFSSSIIGELCLHWRSALAVLAVGVFVWQGWSRLRWADLDAGLALRCFIGILAGTLAWTFSVYDYNLYYDQGHYLERILLVVLFVGSLWRPVLIVPFTALAYAIVHQFGQPVSCTWTDKRALFDLLTLFIAFLGIRLWQPRNWQTIPANEYFFLVIVLQAANYFAPGLGKLLLGWPFIERLDNIFVAAYLNGWHGFLTTEQMLGWAKTIADWNSFFVWSSLTLELIIVFSLWNRRACQLLFASCIGLHCGICLMTGILFWKWIILDATLVGVLFARDRGLTAALFVPHRRWLSVALIVAGPLYFDSHWLAWYDTPLNECFHLEAVTTSGRTYNIPRTLMTPYEVFFAQDKFHFLSHDKFVNGRYGATTSWQVTQRMDGRPSRETADAVREELGETEYNARKTAAFDRFVKRYFQNLNRGGMRHPIPEILQPPQHIYSMVREPRYAGQEPVVMVRVIHERSLYQRDRIETLKRVVVREIQINDDPAQAMIVRKK